MDDLRWILLLVGAVVLVAVYFSGRFEREDWARERKQFRARLRDKIGKKTNEGKNSFGQSVLTAKKEPSMGAVESETTTEKSEPHVPNDLSPINTSKINSGPPTSPHGETITMESATKVDQEIPLERQNETAHAEYFSIEDEITEIEIPADLTVAEAEIQIADTVLEEEPEQTAMPPGIEPLVLSVSVFADEEESCFSGPAIKEALEAEGLLHGTMRIFHFHDPEQKTFSENTDAVFSVASVLEPGFFDLEKLDEIQTPGLMLFCQLPGPLSGEDALEVMLDKGRGLAVRLHGHMCDDKRNRFTTQAKNHYLDRITAFKRELILARKKSSVS